jgi:hypothetical protein
MCELKERGWKGAGTLGVVLGYFVWVPYSPNFYYEEAPLWVYLAAAASIFWSQTMDAVDGKQVCFAVFTPICCDIRSTKMIDASAYFGYHGWSST